MTKRKTAARVKVGRRIGPVSTCTVFCSWQAIACPLCGITVPANTPHSCTKPGGKDAWTIK
jgi:hypothetical protein